MTMGIITDCIEKENNKKTNDIELILSVIPSQYINNQLRVSRYDNFYKNEININVSAKHFNGKSLSIEEQDELLDLLNKELHSKLTSILFNTVVITTN